MYFQDHVVPTTFSTKQETVLVSDQSETVTAAGRITKVQQALKGEGFNPAPIDGVIGSQTIKALVGVPVK